MDIKKTVLMAMSAMIALLFVASGASAHADVVTTLTAYADNAYTSDTDNNFTYTPAADYSIANATLYGNWGGTWAANETNASEITNGSLNWIEVTDSNIPDGAWLFNVEVCDLNNSCTQDTANHTFTVDRTNPVVTIDDLSSPYLCSITPTGTITDTNKDTCSFSSDVDGTIVGTRSGTTCTGTTTTITSGIHSITMTATDLASNTASTSGITVECGTGGGGGGGSYTPSTPATPTPATPVIVGESTTQYTQDIGIGGNRVVSNLSRGFSNVIGAFSGLIAKLLGMFGI